MRPTRSCARSLARTLLCLIPVATVVAAPSLAHAVQYPCTEAGLNSALAAGGVATFACTAPTTITVSNTKTVIRNGTNLDGGGRLILSGGGARRVMTVAAGVTATLRGLTLERGNVTVAEIGGCLRVQGTATVEDTTVRNCNAFSGGDGIGVEAGGTLRMNRGTLTGNGIGAEGTVAVRGVAELTHVTISENGHRGVVARFGGRATLLHCTVVTGTSAPLFAVAPGDSVTVGHSLLVAGAGVPTFEGTGALSSTGYNMFSAAPGVALGGTTTGNQSGVRPLLGPLANNGGLTQTRALLACSPGINAGSTAALAGTDQRGQPRLQQGARDMGAYESNLFPCVTIDDVTQNEGNAGATPFVFTVRLSGAATVATSLRFATANNSATVADGDYVAASGMLSFPAGTTSRTITVNATGDARYEPNEQFLVNLGTASGVAIADAQGVGTIVNDDARPTLRVSDWSVAEGNAGTRVSTFTVTLSQVTSETVTVSYATVNGTATTADGDYVSSTGTLTFPPGTTSRTVAVTVNGDTKHEPDETLLLRLSGPAGATLLDGEGRGTITNDDMIPRMSAGDVRVTEGNAGTTTASFTITLSNPSASSVTASYATANGTATVADNDYVAATGTLTFPAGTTSRTVSVVVNGDTTFEPDETFALNLTTPTNATLADGQGIGTIANDDGAPVVSIADASVAEGNAGTSPLVFELRLSAPSGTPTTVSYATADGTAVSTGAAADFTAASGTVTFAPGVTRQTATVLVRGDTTLENDETLTVTLSAPSGATLGDGSAQGTITNDDAPPALTVGDVSVAEGDTGTTEAVFTVRLASPSALPASVSYATADGTAIGGTDYEDASGTLTFAPGETSQTVAVQVLGDEVFEGDETFSLVLSGPSGATLMGDTGVGTITDDEAFPGLSVGSASSPEGDAGEMFLVLTVTLSGASAGTVTVDWATADGTATVADDDYIESSGTLTFAPGETSHTVSVLVSGDTTSEPDETFTVLLSNASGAAIAGAEGTATIVDDDGEPALSVAPVSVAEGDVDRVSAELTVTLSHASSVTVTVEYATADGTATAADDDYIESSGTLTFAPGETSQTVSVEVLGDTAIEPDETFSLVLSAPTNATLSVESAEATITNDDAERMPDAGPHAGEDAGVGAPDGGGDASVSGCGCVVAGGGRPSSAPWGVGALVALAAARAARRRRAR